MAITKHPEQAEGSDKDILKNGSLKKILNSTIQTIEDNK